MNTTTPNHSTPLFRRNLNSPIGDVAIIADRDAIVAILWDLDAPIGDGEARNPVERHLGNVEVSSLTAGENAALDAAVSQLEEYFAGQRTEFDLPLAPRGTEFQRSAWQALQGIPYGETVSYGQQAKLIGDVNKARAVGAANGKNPIPIVVPCHRVVGSDGSLTGFAGGISVKRWLLDHERFTLMAS